MHTAVPEVSVTFPQPEISVPFEVKPTTPVGVGGPPGVIVAVIVTCCPPVEGLGELITVVVLASRFTTCRTVFEGAGRERRRALIHRDQAVSTCRRRAGGQHCEALVIERN